MAGCSAGTWRSEIHSPRVCGDPQPSPARTGCADGRIASQKYWRRAIPSIRYANLAVRGRTMDEILAEQIQTAVMLEPDHRHHLCRHERSAVGAQRHRRDDGALRRCAEDAAADRRRWCSRSPRLISAPCRCSADCAAAPRSTTNCSAAIVDDIGVQLVDFWRFSEFRDPRLWDGDRIHLSQLGHERMAAKVLDTLTVPHNLTTRSAALLASSPPVRSWSGRTCGGPPPSRRRGWHAGYDA